MLLSTRNRFSRSSITGDAPVVVNLTSFGLRIASAFGTIESIGAGSARPRRLILWLEDHDAIADPPPELRRLMRRGLEVLPCEDHGPHKKQYPYVTAYPEARDPLVTADDDVLYPRWWLAELVAAYRTRPADIATFLAFSITFDEEGGIAPYATWPRRHTTDSSFVAIARGTSGVVYPPAFLDAMRSEGERFREAAPRGNDIWVSAVAARAGIRTWQIRPEPLVFTQVPGTQHDDSLWRYNRDGGYDVRIPATYGATEIARMRAEPDAVTVSGDGNATDATTGAR